MFFYNGALLMDGSWFEVTRAGLTAVFGVFLLSSGVQGWFAGRRAAWFLRVLIIASALFMIEGGGLTDLIGIGGAVLAFFVQKVVRPDPDAQLAVKGAD